LEDAIAAIDKIAMPIDAQDRKFFFSFFKIGTFCLLQNPPSNLPKFSELDFHFHFPFFCG
jgi:hypothetical protein